MSKKNDKINRLENTKATQSENQESVSGVTRRKFINYSTFALLAAALPLSFSACGSGDGGGEPTWNNNAGNPIPWSNSGNPWSNNANPWSNTTNPWSNNATPWSNNATPWSNSANPYEPSGWTNGTNPSPGGTPWNNSWSNTAPWSNNPWSNNTWNNFVNSGVKNRKT